MQASPSALVGKTGSGGDRVSAAGPVSPVGLPPELAIAPPPPPGLLLSSFRGCCNPPKIPFAPILGGCSCRAPCDSRAGVTFGAFSSFGNPTLLQPWSSVGSFSSPWAPSLLHPS